MTRIKPKELQELVELPEQFRECWLWFIALNNSRASGFGVSPISFTEIYYYFLLFRIDVQPWEVEAIKMFDNVAMQVAQARQDKQNKTK